MITCVVCLAIGVTLAQPVSPLQQQRDQLQMAIVKRDSARLAALIATGMKLDFNFDDEAPRQRSGESPLTMTANRDYVEGARLLLGAGASVQRLDGSDATPLHAARSAAMARLLVAAGADPNALNRRGYTALAGAVDRGDLGRVDALLANGARFDAPSRSPDVFTLALQARKPELVPALLERGADPRRPPTQALAPLIEAGDTERAKLLLARGADPDAGNATGPVLLLALLRKRWEIADALVAAGASLRIADGPQCASVGGCGSIELARQASFEPALLKRLAARGLDLNAVAANGHSALSSVIVEQPMAVRAIGPAGKVSEIPAPDNAARVRALLEAGADPNLPWRGMTPLMLAVLRGGGFGDAIFAAGGRVEYAETIAPDPAKAAAMPLERASDVTAQLVSPSFNYRGVNTGMTIGPLTWTVLQRRPDLAVRLLERDRRIAADDRYLLYFAAFLGAWDVVLAAPRYGADANAGDRADVMPLMLAAESGQGDAVRALLGAGARVNARSTRDWPPLLERNLKEEFGAAIAGHSPAKPRLVGGYTALGAAKERGHSEVARILAAAGGRE